MTPLLSNNESLASRLREVFFPNFEKAIQIGKALLWVMLKSSTSSTCSAVVGNVPQRKRPRLVAIKYWLSTQHTKPSGPLGL